MATKIQYNLNKVYDPSSEFIVKWNHVMFVIGVINFYMDPMFMYIPKLSNTKSIIDLDLQLGLILGMLRTVGDCLLLLRILMKFRTAYEIPGTAKVFRKRRLMEDHREIAINYLKSSFIVDLVAVLPMPQAYIWLFNIASETSQMSAFTTYLYLYIIFWIQFFPRFAVVYSSKEEITKTAGILMKSGMSGALYNLLWLMNSSNTLKGLDVSEFEWEKLLSNCSETNEIELGLFSAAFDNKVGSRSFIQKYMFCFSWGLKSISSLGQNFTTSYSTMDTSLSIAITLVGLIFFADLVTRMQAGIQSMEEREEQQRARQREIKEWMHYHQLPPGLKERVDLAIQSEWTENGIDDEVMLDSLPMDLRSEIRKYLYMELVSKLPKFENMGAELVEAICQHLRTFSGREGAYLVYEGDTVRQMLFIFSGELELSFADRGNTSVTVLGPGECCGQELVTWASQPATSLDNLPSSTWTIKCLTDVEAFVLQAYDMKILATQFAHNQEFQRAFKQHYP